MSGDEHMELFESAAQPAAAVPPRPAVTASVQSRAEEPPRGQYLVFARKWRPQNFEQVAGQGAVSASLQNAINDGRIGHAFLFTGPRGVGKTSMARIFSKALNCLATSAPNPQPCGRCDQCRSIAAGTNLDVIEIDGASNNKVEEIRELREAAGYTPFGGRYKVYIIDEVHMLTINAFNALLKTLEEPPPRVIFILATTELHKIPATIVSRCQHCEFQTISRQDIIQRLDFILQQERTPVAEGQRQTILETIAHFAEGGMRDAQVALDQAITLSSGPLTLEAVQELLGLIDCSICEKILLGVRTGNVEELLLLVRQLTDRGRDLPRVVRQLLRFTRDLLVLVHSRGFSGPAEALIECPAEQLQAMRKLAAEVSAPFLLNLSNRLIELDAKMKGTAPRQFLFELALIELAVASKDLNVTQLLGEIRNLKQLLERGEPPAGAAATGPRPHPKQAAAAAPVFADRGAAPAPQAPAARRDDFPLGLEQPRAVWEALLVELAREQPALAEQCKALELVSLSKRAIELRIAESPRAIALRESIFGDARQTEQLQTLLRKITGCAPAIECRIESAAAGAAQPDGEPADPVAESGWEARPNPAAIARVERNRQPDAAALQPERRVEQLLAEYPAYREELKAIMQLIGGGSIVRCDGVPLQRPIAQL